jgi:hypothetical protein
MEVEIKIIMGLKRIVAIEERKTINNNSSILRLRM